MAMQRDRRSRIMPPPNFKTASRLAATTEPKRPGAARDLATLRAAITRYQSRHGPDACIEELKRQLADRGEERWRLDAMAPKPGAAGQLSLLDAGR